jgi:hypothetical protein
MANRLKREHLSAELATLDALIGTLPHDDVLGRIGLQSRREEIVSELDQIKEIVGEAASIALFFGGRPVTGSKGIEASFGADAVSKFQDLVTNVWGTADRGGVGSRGPLPASDLSKLHITSLLHGSVGFLLEEMEPQDRLFDSPLKKAADRTADVIAAFAGESEQNFSAILETVDQRVLGSAREFFRQVYQKGANLRIVEGEKDLVLDGAPLERAYSRAENAEIQDEDEPVRGVLLGLIPIGRRFELRKQDGTILSGSVAETLSEAYLKRLTQEELVGKLCRGRIKRKRITRFSKVTESFVLLDLEEDARN